MVQALDDSRRRQASGGRVPPHNLQAEESLLGAMLLSRDAIVSAVERQLGTHDFYKPAHGHVYDAITTLYAQGEPADVVTVAEELRRAGVLDAIGGPALLLSLQAGTPAIGNAARYARIVEEHALLRRLIEVAGNIAELGYDLPDDVISAIDQAEAMVFEVAQRRVTDSLRPLRDLLERHLDHIEALYERGEDITGVPTGYIDLDHQLAGLQPSNLVIVGGRPGTGKALALDTPIPTPSGWTTMGELQVGHEVLDGNGQPCTVTFATPVMHGRPCYQVCFDDGSELVADAEHQWFAYDFPAWKSLREAQYRLSRPPSDPALSRDQSSSRRMPRVVTTEQMLDEGIHACADQRPNWYIPLTRPLDLPEADLPVDPYVLGCWLGDGKSSGSAIIPAAYLRASFKQRLALLQGLLDTDGHIERQGTVDLCLSNLPLLQQARELVCSLGHKPGSIRQRSITLAAGGTATAWRFGWMPLDPVFRMPRKAERYEAARSRRTSGRPTRRAVTAIRPVPSVPVRCITVDSPDHLYLAGEAMVPTHNTAFALGLVAHAAVESQCPVLLFSLEMSHLELTQRLICSEARVDATRMRNGRLLETDWPKISHAVGRLADAPVFIDDNPHLTVMEIRAKARRLKSRSGLGLIVIDYLQLMGGRTDAENRQVEVSEISRGLKILARELEVPVVALSQLSRGLETRADKRPMLADLRESGCLTAETRVVRADTGAEVTMGQLFVSGEQDISVWSLDEDLKMTPANMRRVFSTGVKPVFELRLASGRELRATGNHPFLTIDGWSQLDALTPGDRIAVPRRVPEPRQAKPWPEAEVVMLAQLLGDGCLPAAYRVTHNKHNPILSWLDGLGLKGLRSFQTFIPERVFGLPREQLSLFLRHLWATDGSVGFFGDQSRIYYSSTSKRLVEQVQQLLLRFEIQTRLATVAKSGSRLSYHLHVNGAENQLRFVDQIGVHGKSGEAAQRLRPALARVSKQPYVDSTPTGMWDRIVEGAKRSGTSRSALVRDAGFAGSFARTPPSRNRLGAVAELLDDEGVRRLASSDVLWDRIVSITSAGNEPVFDAEVDETHNFVANGVTSSNSLEQDSDVVIFLYRDEVYNRDSPDRGTAEVIVAKHRNGPTGTTQLAFLDHYTRFANMAKGV